MLRTRFEIYPFGKVIPIEIVEIPQYQMSESNLNGCFGLCICVGLGYKLYSLHPLRDVVLAHVSFMNCQALHEPFVCRPLL